MSDEFGVELEWDVGDDSDNEIGVATSSSCRN